MNTNVKAILESNMCFLGTVGETVNVVPIHYKHVTEEGNIVMVDNYMNKSKANVIANGLATVSAYGKGNEGYQVKGKAEYLAEGELFDKCAAMFDIPVKGVVYITSEEIWHTTPGDNAGKKVEE